MVEARAVASAAPAGSADAGLARKTPVANFEDFLRLLAEQLEQQDPLEPMDTEKFTDQLVQFTAVEQARVTNERMGALVDTMLAGQLLAAAGYVGKEVEFRGDTLHLGDSGGASVAYSLPRTAERAELKISSADGEEVRRLLVPVEAGAHTVEWDGRDTSGRRLPAGSYRVEILALDASGDAIDADLRTAAVVDAVFLDGEELLFEAGGIRRPADTAIAVRAAAHDAPGGPMNTN